MDHTISAQQRRGQKGTERGCEIVTGSVHEREFLAVKMQKHVNRKDGKGCWNMGCLNLEFWLRFDFC